jgi:hypothetical protein
MKNNLLFLVIVLFLSTLAAQSKYYTKTGTIDFEASVPSFEEVKATSNTVTSVINVTTGEIAVLALVKGFRFKVALMEEHFNENYAESDKFPKATLTGKIKNFSLKNLTTVSKLFELNGKLTFHGKTIYIDPEISISLNENTIHLIAGFVLNPEDFDIKIPKLIRKKVAETVEVTINFMLSPKTQ